MKVWMKDEGVEKDEGKDHQGWDRWDWESEVGLDGTLGRKTRLWLW